MADRTASCPSRLKAILDHVIEGEQATQANLIQGRKTVAVCCPADIARLLAEDPVLDRIQEPELMQEILRGGKVPHERVGGDIAGQMHLLTTCEDLIFSSGGR